MDVIQQTTFRLIIFMGLCLLVGCDKDANVIGILAEGAPQVESDGQGNFFATWQSANAIMVRHYPQAEAQPPLRLGYGKTPSVTVGQNGVAYVAWQGNDSSNDRGHVRHYQPSEDRWLTVAETGSEPNFYETSMQRPKVTATNDFAFLTWSTGGALSKTGTSQFFTNPAEPTGPTWAFNWYPYVRAYQAGTYQYADNVTYVSTAPSGNSNGSSVGVSSGGGQIFFDYACDNPVTASAGFRQTIVLCLANRTQSGMDYQVWEKNTKLHSIAYEVPPGSHIVPYVKPTYLDQLSSFNDRVYPGDYALAMDDNGHAIAVWASSWQPTSSRPNRDDNFFFYRYSTYTPGLGWTAPINIDNTTHRDISRPKLERDNAGNVYLIYREKQGSNQTIQMRQFSFATGWLPAEQLHSENANIYRPDLAVSPSGDLLAVWERDGAILMKRRNSGDSTWLPTIIIGKGDWPDAALDNQGRCVVVWKDGSDIKEFTCAEPIPAFTYSPQPVELGALITFDASASRDEDGVINYFEWDFNEDGQTDAFFATANHTFTELGNVDVTLTVTDNDGRKKSFTQTLTVIDGQTNLDPTASYTEVSQRALIGGTEVELSASASTDLDGTIGLYRWDVDNDGSFDFETTVPRITLTLQPGVVPVRLQVVDNEGSTGEFLDDIQVQQVFIGDPQLTVVISGGPGAGEVRTNEQPIPNFTCINSAEPTTVCSETFLVDTVIVLIAEANNLPATYNWTGCDFVGEAPNGGSACRVTFLGNTRIEVEISSP